MNKIYIEEEEDKKQIKFCLLFWIERKSRQRKEQLIFISAKISWNIGNKEVFFLAENKIRQK